MAMAPLAPAEVVEEEELLVAASLTWMEAMGPMPPTVVGVAAVAPATASPRDKTPRAGWW